MKSTEENETEVVSELFTRKYIASYTNFPN